MLWNAVPRQKDVHFSEIFVGIWSHSFRGSLIVLPNFFCILVKDRIFSVFWLRTGFSPQIDGTFPVHKNRNWKINTNRQYILNPVKIDVNFPVYKNETWATLNSVPPTRKKWDFALFSFRAIRYSDIYKGLSPCLLNQSFFYGYQAIVLPFGLLTTSAKTRKKCNVHVHNPSSFLSNLLVFITFSSYSLHNLSSIPFQSVSLHNLSILPFLSASLHNLSILPFQIW